MIKNRIYTNDEVIKYNNTFPGLGYIPIFVPINDFSSKFFHFKGVLKKLSNEDISVINFFKGKLFKPEDFKRVEGKLNGYKYVISHTNVLDRSKDLLSIRLLSKIVRLKDEELDDLFLKAEKSFKNERHSLLRETSGFRSR
ncbi:MAG: hypothetical protein ACI4N3_00950 [Alphaproteobacteria bacterium]